MVKTFRYSWVNDLTAGNCIKRTVVCLVAFCLLFSLVSCQNDGDGNKSIFEQLLQNAQTDGEDAKPFADKVYVVIPKDASATLASKASDFVKAIADKTSVETLLKYDNENISVAENETEILVGYTNRLSSDEALGLLKLGDYVCRWDKGKLILGGRYEEATVTAIDHFCQTLLSGASRGYFVSQDAHFEHFEKYDVGSVCLNGYDLYDFTIVYPDENKNSEHEVANVIRAYIAQKSGYWIDVIPISKVDDSTGKVISVGKTSFVSDNKQTYNSFVESSAECVAIYGKDSYGISCAAVTFLEKLFGSLSGKDAIADLSERITLNYANSSLSLCSAIITFDGKDQNEFLENVQKGFSERLKANDVTFIYNVNYDVSQTVKNNIPSGYDLTALSFGEDSQTIAVYNKSRVERVELRNVDGFLVSTVALLESDESYNVFHGLGALGASADALKKIVSDPNGYNIVVLDRSNSEMDISNESLDFIGGGNCFASGKLRSRSFYINGGVMRSGAVSNDAYNGISCARAFVSTTVSVKYVKGFLELTNTAK